MSTYAGFKPSQEIPLFPTKCSFNTRVNMVDRAAVVQQGMAQAAAKKAATPDPSRPFFLQKRHIGGTTYDRGANAIVRTASDIPQRQNPGATTTTTQGRSLSTVPFMGETATHQTLRNVADGHDSSFYSRVRKTERSDDDIRRDVYIPPTRSGASTMQRTVDIMRKREEKTELQPPKETFHMPPRAPPAVPVAKAHSPGRFANALPPQTVNQVDFQPPNILLSATNNKAPQPNSQRRVMTEISTSQDMFDGTPKARNDLIPGYMGHVPANKNNSKQIHGGEADALRMTSKNPINLAVPAKRLTAASEADRRRPKTETVTGFMEHEMTRFPTERTLNRPEHNRKMGIRHFFATGDGDADNVAADQYCVKFKPTQGGIRVGPRDTWSWVPENQLKRTTPM